MAQVRALMANGAYLESKEGQELRAKEVEAINERFDGAIQSVRDPGKHKREMAALREDPLMSAGIRGLDNLKWRIRAGVNPFKER